MNLKQLKTLIRETVREEKSKSRNSSRGNKWNSLVEATTLKVLLEGDEDGLEPAADAPPEEEAAAPAASGAGYNEETNTKGAPAEQLIEDMFDNIPAFRAAMDAMGTGWGLKDTKDDESFAVARDSIFKDKATALSRLTSLNKKLDDGKGFSKAYMPAFEGVDADALANVLDSESPHGEPKNMGVDFEEDWNVAKDFDSYWEKIGGEEATVSLLPDDDAKVEESANLYRWNKLAGLLKEAESFSGGGEFPFPGPATTMNGAVGVGNSDKVKPQPHRATGVAKAYLEKGIGTGDKMSVSKNQSLAHNSMIPTQREVKLGKTLAFAFQDIGQDMGGAFADNEGNILDGHHRWSGQELRGFDGQHAEVNIINRSSEYSGKGTTPKFLKLLSTISAALGRPTKLK
jgi:hypothetical protein